MYNQIPVKFFTLKPGAGLFINLTVVSKAESNFKIFSSTLLRVLKISFLRINVALHKTATFAFGKCLLPILTVSSIMQANSGCIVGSLFPAKVITSGGLCQDFIFCKTSFNCVFTFS